MIIVWAIADVARMERSLRSVIQVLLAEMMIMAPILGTARTNREQARAYRCSERLLQLR